MPEKTYEKIQIIYLHIHIIKFGKNVWRFYCKTSTELTHLKNSTFSTLPAPFNITLTQFLHIPKRIFETAFPKVKVIMSFVIGNFTHSQFNWPQFFVVD